MLTLVGSNRWRRSRRNGDWKTGGRQLSPLLMMFVMPNLNLNHRNTRALHLKYSSTVPNLSSSETAMIQGLVDAIQSTLTRTLNPICPN